MSYKILYLGSDANKLPQGTYYSDWLKAINKLGQVYCYGPGYKTQISQLPKCFDLIVYSHQFFDDFSLRKLDYFGLNILRFRKIRSIIFSKNEYKMMFRRFLLLQITKKSVLVVYTKKTYDKFSKFTKKIIWAPFSASEISIDGPKTKDICFRGNLHENFIGKLRSDFIKYCTEKFIDYNNEIYSSKNGENFLEPVAYKEWLAQFRFALNTESAMGIVNPKFAEAMSLGVINICPVGFYEGLLIEDVHYVTPKKAQILLSSSDEYDSFLQKYKKKSKEYLARYSYEKLLIRIIMEKY